MKNKSMTLSHEGKRYKVTADSDRFVDPVFDKKFSYRVGSKTKKYELGEGLEYFISGETLEEVFMGFLTETLSEGKNSPLMEIFEDSGIVVESLE